MADDDDCWYNMVQSIFFVRLVYKYKQGSQTASIAAQPLEKKKQREEISPASEHPISNVNLVRTASMSVVD